MILFMLIALVSVFVDIYFHKTIKNKNDKIYYVVCILITAGFAIFYYTNPFREGLAEYVLGMLNMGGLK